MAQERLELWGIKKEQVEEIAAGRKPITHLTVTSSIKGHVLKKYVREGQYVFWLVDIAALVGVGGIWCWWFLWQLRQRPLLPVHDPYWPEVMHHE